MKIGNRSLLKLPAVFICLSKQADAQRSDPELNRGSVPGWQYANTPTKDAQINIMKLIISSSVFCLLVCQPAFSQPCKTNESLDTVAGKYLTAAQYPWPAVRAAYFNNLTSAADKSIAKQTLNQIEKTEARSHSGFLLTGGNWENYYFTKGYGYYGDVRLGKYSFESSLHEFFCLNGKLKRNDEAGTILRIHVNEIPTNTLNCFLDYPFGSSIGEYDFGLQYLDWKNHQPADVNAQLINLFSYMSCSSTSLLEAINSGHNYFQDVPEKDIRPNNRSNFIYRYWFVKKKDIPVLVPVTRKEYLQSLLEYYEREKLYFPKLISKLTEDHDNGVKQYSSWEADLAAKTATVKKILSESAEDWLSAQAVINRLEDASQTYRAGLKERTNYNRFWKFYGQEKNSVPLYRYNPDYFKKTAAGPARPQIITVAFRYVTIPSSLRILLNFTQHIDIESLEKMVE